MCGSTDQQTDTYDAQQGFFNQALAQQKISFGKDLDILTAMQGVYQPMFAAGPSQEGFSPAEKAELSTAITENTATNYGKAAQAWQGKLATLGGGTLALPSGANEQIMGNVATSAAGEMSKEQLQVQQANYAQGYQNWMTAGKGLLDVSQQLNPIGYSTAATASGSAASTTANDIATQANSWINAAIGAAGNIGEGAATGGMSAFVNNKMGG